MDGLVKQHDWLADKRFATNADRVANRAILEPLIEAYFLEHTCDELLDKLIPFGMACSAAYRISEAMVSPHAQARGSVLEIDYPGVGPVKSANNPIKLSEAPLTTRRKSPGMGEHTVEIMRKWVSATLRSRPCGTPRRSRRKRTRASISSGPRASCALKIMSGPEARGPEDSAKERGAVRGKDDAAPACDLP